MRFDQPTAFHSKIRGGIALFTLAVLSFAPFHYAYAFDDSGDAVPAISDDISEASGPGWDQVEADEDGSGSQVLEVPSVARIPDSSSAAGADNDQQASTADGDDAANEDAIPLGDVADYQSQQSVPSAVPVWPPPVVVMGFSRPMVSPYGLSSPRPGAIVVRPNGLTPILPTSPMLMTPRTSIPRVSGWWMRAR